MRQSTPGSSAGEDEWADRFPEAAALMGERRSQVLELAHSEGVELAAQGVSGRWTERWTVDRCSGIQ